MRIGIDLGTTFTLTSHLNAQGVPALVPDLHYPNEYRTASAVHIEGDTALVGRAIEEALLEDATLPVARGFKSGMGRDASAWVDRAGRAWTAEQLSAVVLRKQLRDVDAHLGEDVDLAVITVPANFSDQQRKATQLAARLAGLPSVHLIEEPIAAAAFHGFDARGAEQTLLVYDFGGGTFDATVLHIAGGRIYVLATDGHNELGGRRIDSAIMQLVQDEARRRHGIDLGADHAGLELVRRHAEEAKVMLGQPGRTMIRRTLLAGGRALDFMISRDMLDQVVRPLVEESMAICERCLEGAALNWGLIDRVLLTGGSSLLPQVHQRMIEATGRGGDFLHSRHPHQAVAYGAALIAEAHAAGAGNEPTIAVAPYHLGIRVRDPATGADRIEALVKRNTPLPARHTATFYTSRADQTRIILDIVQSKGPADPVHSLGVIAFGPLRRPQRNHPVEVTLGYDAEGLVRITARDPVSGEALEREFSGGGDAALAQLQAGRGLVQGLRIGP